MRQRREQIENQLRALAETLRFGRPSRGQFHPARNATASERTGSSIEREALCLRLGLQEPFVPRRCWTPEHFSLGGEIMGKEWAQQLPKNTGENTAKEANEAGRRAGAEAQHILDQGKSIAQDVANRASETARQATDRAGEFIEGVAPQAREMASNLYEQGSQTGEYVRQYTAQQPLPALLIAVAIGYALGYLVHRP